MHSSSSKTARPANATGRVLRQTLHGKSPTQRAQIAAALASGQVRLIDPLPAQAGRLVDRGRASGALYSDPHVDRLIQRIGADRIMVGLERATRPPVSAE
jgi:hypothetical protein